MRIRDLLSSFPQHSAKILDLIRSHIGLGIIEQSTEAIVVKNFFTIDAEVAPSFLLKKMDTVNRAMLTVLEEFFLGQYVRDDYAEIQKLHEQNKHLNTLIKKCLLKIVENPKLMPLVQTTHLLCMKEKIIASLSMQMSTNLLTLGNIFLLLDPRAKEVRILQDSFQILHKTYVLFMKALNARTHDSLKNFLTESMTTTKRIEGFIRDRKSVV